MVEDNVRLVGCSLLNFNVAIIRYLVSNSSTQVELLMTISILVAGRKDKLSIQ